MINRIIIAIKRNTIIKEWSKFWWKIDLIGFIIGLTLILLYIFDSKLAHNNNELKDIWANLATEIVGVWLGARVIGVIIEKKSKFNDSRFILLRNLNYFSDISKRITQYNTDLKVKLWQLEHKINFAS